MDCVGGIMFRKQNSSALAKFTTLRDSHTYTLGYIVALLIFYAHYPLHIRYCDNIILLVHKSACILFWYWD